MELQGRKINFLGDSITAGVGVKSRDAIFLNVLKERAGLAEARNYGISATRIARQSVWQTENLPAFCDRFDKMDADADVIVVFGGTNDYGHGDAPLGCMADRTPDTFYGGCHLLMQGLIEKYPSAEIVFMTPLHRAGDDRPAANERKLGHSLVPLKTYVDIIRETAAFYGLPVLDLFASAGICPDIEASRKTFCPDGLHPNEAGHLRIEGRLENFLKAL